MNTVKVNCDRCGHSRVVPFDDLPSLHNQPCPACHASIPVNDQDMAAFHAIKAAMAVGLVGSMSADASDLPDDAVAVLHVDTAPLRKAKS